MIHDPLRGIDKNDDIHLAKMKLKTVGVYTWDPKKMLPRWPNQPGGSSLLDRANLGSREMNPSRTLPEWSGWDLVVHPDLEIVDHVALIQTQIMHIYLHVPLLKIWVTAMTIMGTMGEHQQNGQQLR